MALLFLGSCASAPQPPPMPKAPPAIVDPPDQLVKPALHDYFKTQDAPIATTYKMMRIDLNRDTRRDAVVYLKTPYGYWCGFEGCPMLVLKARNDGFDIHSHIHPVRGPVTISDQTTSGWRNIIMRVSGRSAPPKDVVLRFDGVSYPHNPETLPEYASFIDHNGSRFFE